MNTVLFSPRRYGKTSLVKRVLNALEKKNILTIYTDLLGISTKEEVTSRLARSIYQATYKKKGICEKALHWITGWRPVIKPDLDRGMILTVERIGHSKPSLIEETLEGIGKLSSSLKHGCCVAIDEFQEITALPRAAQIEAVMRSQIQSQDKTSYIFIGSRRKLLQDMFLEKNRPFYKSALSFPLPPLPSGDLSEYFMESFAAAGKKCTRVLAEQMAKLTNGYAYYSQKLGYCIFENSENSITEKNIREGYTELLQKEKGTFKAMLSPLALQQRSLLKAIASEPIKRIFSKEYMQRHETTSLGGMQGALKKLIELDYIELNENVYRAVDPVFADWLNKN